MCRLPPYASSRTELDRAQRAAQRAAVRRSSVKTLLGEKLVDRRGDRTGRAEVRAVSHVLDDRELAAWDLAVHVFAHGHRRDQVIIALNDQGLGFEPRKFCSNIGEERDPRE